MSSRKPPAFPKLAIILGLIVFYSVSVTCYRVHGRNLHVLDANGLHDLINAGNPLKSLDTSNPDSHLSHILIPRPSGSTNNTAVRSYIASTLKKLKWHVEEDTFKENTPYGEKEFTNIIATWDPLASKRLIMSAHFDSKFFPRYPQNQFVGATDSAAPCAMLLDLADSLTPSLDARLKHLTEAGDDADDIEDTTLQLVFFDGEEAFKDWTGTDHTYGSRHLAQKWASTYIARGTTRARLHPSATMISTIEHLVLLDLLGATRPLVRSYFPTTGWLFDAMVSAETRLGESGVFNVEGAEAWGTHQSFFMPRTNYHISFGHVDDDHMDFLRRGVNILHVITEPFPRVWHTIQDDASALDPNAMKRWNLIFRVFVAEYLGLQPQTSGKERARGELLP